MNDDAVAPVIAAMLVLAIIVTVFSVWTAVALPSMKAESEMNHLREVEHSFMQFSADLSNTASLKQDVAFSQTVSLGGGGVIFNSLSSSGTIRVDEETRPVFDLFVVNGSAVNTLKGRLVKFSYRPEGNYWQDQGYIWHYGFVNVTKGRSYNNVDNAMTATPLSYASMSRVNRAAPVKKFAGTLIDLEARPWSNSSYNCSEIIVSAVTFSPEPGAQFASGNGISMFGAAASVNESVFGIRGETAPDRLVIRVNKSQPEAFSLDLYNKCNQSMYRFNQSYPFNVWYHADNSSPLYREVSVGPVPGSLPFSITQKSVQVNVSAY
jgi:hypothetical protein